MSREIIELVADKVSIPEYVEKVIVPEMPWYFTDYTVDFDLRPYMKCPLHGEDTPSLKYYEETNTFYCFGCGAGGDVVQFHKKFVEKLNSDIISRDEAADFLYKKFIDGINETLKRRTKPGVVKILPEGKIEQNDIGLARFQRYYTYLDRLLQKDETVKLDLKTKIYNAIDTVITLVKDDVIVAEEATEWLKKEFDKIMGGANE